MNIVQLINEEFDNFMNEIEVTERIPTYPFEAVSDDRYRIHVSEPEKNINVNYMVSIGKSSNEENSYGLSFKVEGGDYYDVKNFGVQFRLLATISKVVKDFMSKHEVDILRFQPVKKAGSQLKGGRSDSQRMMLYMNYVKAGAGDEFDAFIIGDNQLVNVERRNPTSYSLQTPDTDAETIQDIVTQLSKFEGKYVTDLPPYDPDSAEFGISSWGDFYVKYGDGQYNKYQSARKFVDELINTPLVKYKRGAKDPSPRVPVTARLGGQLPPDERDAPIEPVRRRAPSEAPIGSFPHFMQTEIYGNHAYDVLNPYFETIKTLNDFQLLRERTRHAMQAARTAEDRTRLADISNAIDSLMHLYQQYERRHQNPNVRESLDVLNEIEDLLK
jgi:hypothetical protein